MYGTGSCSDPGMTCPRSDDDKCLKMLNTSYKVKQEKMSYFLIFNIFYFQFYFSFENSLCVDYITEKFFKVLNNNVIPVVLNGVNMTQHAPPHSYIDIKDFKNLKGKRFSFLLKVIIKSFTDAAKYMIKVSEDDKLFSSYFWWRDFYIANIRNSWSEVKILLLL